MLTLFVTLFSCLFLSYVVYILCKAAGVADREMKILFEIESERLDDN